MSSNTYFSFKTKRLLPSKESYERRVKFVKKVERLLNSEWPDHDIKPNVFGY